MMRTVLAIGLCLCATAGSALEMDKQDGTVAVRGEWFELTLDTRTGGAITSLRLFDGVQWNTVCSGPANAFPNLCLADGDREYATALDTGAKLVSAATTGDIARASLEVVPRAVDGTPAPWTVTLDYEIYPEGAVFVDVTSVLREGSLKLNDAHLTFSLDDAIANAPKYGDENRCIAIKGFRSARALFGLQPGTSYTNELEVYVEDNRPMTGATAQTQERGRWTWVLGDGGAVLEAPFIYRNRIAMGLGSAVNGKPRSNCVAQRVYHWVNFLDKVDWYPTNEEIDKMVALNATMLVMHHEYMLQRGSNGYPHADYGVIRDHDEMVRAIDYAHAKGLRVGLYMRGVEEYALATEFFRKYCQRNWDGIYVDWHGPSARAWHDERYTPETQYGDTHFSADGLTVPARAYFLFTRRLREIVGPEGFLIGHQGSFCAGLFSNLCFDAYLPGETSADHHMLGNRDIVTAKGMLGGGICMPWTLDLKLYRNPEGAAKMAVWGLYPHLVAGIKARRGEGYVFPRDPADEQYAFVQPYWNLLTAIDAEKAAVFNGPAQAPRAASSSNPKIECIVYRTPDAYLVIAANLGEAPASATLTLNPKVLGMEGAYSVNRLDPASGEGTAVADTETTLDTGELQQWGLTGYLLKAK
ncbi:MAG: hypothetical protein GY851_10365 [bacterium]|nr:hypothetical protein [bacterium]